MTKDILPVSKNNHVFPFYSKNGHLSYIMNQWADDHRLSLYVHRCEDSLLHDVLTRRPQVVIFGAERSLLSSGIILRLAAIQNRPTVVSLLKSRNEELVAECYDQGADRVVAVPDCSANIFKALIGTLIRNEHCYPPYRINSEIQTINVGNSEVRLTKKTFDVAQYLFVNHGELISKPRILLDLWGLDSKQCITHRIEVHISHVRKLLALDGTHGWEIKARRGMGYGIFHNESAC